MCILLCSVLHVSVLYLSACMHLEIFVCTYIYMHVRILVSVIYYPVLFSGSRWINFFTIWSLLSWTSWVKRVAWFAVYATRCQYTWQVLCVAAGISFNYFFLMCPCLLLLLDKSFKAGCFSPFRKFHSFFFHTIFVNSTNESLGTT